MKKMTAYRLRKDTIGYKAGEIFVKMSRDSLFDCSKMKLAHDIDLSKIENNFSEWFEEGEIEVPYFPEKNYQDFFFVDMNQMCSKEWHSSLADGVDIGKIISWNCFPTEEMTEKALKKIKKALRDFWLEQENGTSEEKNSELVFHQKEEE